ncbi:MAG: hypothetical protein JWR20_2363 [Marmoricola sp.]|jgi:hypothetical protein|nr:hypothetical protein [Marmoricola sp.]
MTDTYVYLIREQDWDSDAVLAGEQSTEQDDVFAQHGAFAEAVARLGARIVQGAALQTARHGGVVTPGEGDRAVEDAVWTDSPYADSSELITGFYLVEAADEETARHVAALVPTGSTVEWRKVFPTG